MHCEKTLSCILAEVVQPLSQVLRTHITWWEGRKWSMAREKVHVGASVRSKKETLESITEDNVGPRVALGVTDYQRMGVLQNN